MIIHDKLKTTFNKYDKDKFSKEELALIKEMARRFTQRARCKTEIEVK